jgi:hypothetical protein
MAHKINDLEFLKEPHHYNLLICHKVPVKTVFFKFENHFLWAIFIPIDPSASANERNH